VNLTDVRKFFDKVSGFIVLISSVYIFFFLALAPPRQFFPALDYFMRRVSTVNVFGVSVVLPNLVWIAGFFLSGSVLLRVLFFLGSVFPSIDVRSEGEKYLQRHDVKRFDD